MLSLRWVGIGNMQSMFFFLSVFAHVKRPFSIHDVISLKPNNLIEIVQFV